MVAMMGATATACTEARRTHDQGQGPRSSHLTFNMRVRHLKWDITSLSANEHEDRFPERKSQNWGAWA